MRITYYHIRKSTVFQISAVQNNNYYDLIRGSHKNKKIEQVACTDYDRSPQLLKSTEIKSNPQCTNDTVAVRGTPTGP